MGKNIVDGPRPGAGETRTARYAEIERREGEEPGRAAKALHRQEHGEDDAATLQRFAAIDRRAAD